MGGAAPKPAAEAADMPDRLLAGLVPSRAEACGWAAARDPATEPALMEVVPSVRLLPAVVPPPW